MFRVCNRTCVFQGEARCSSSLKHGVNLSAEVRCRWQYQSLRSRPGTDEMAVVDVKARFQTGTTDNSSNQILKISDSDMDSGVFNVFVIISKVK